MEQSKKKMKQLIRNLFETIVLIIGYTKYENRFKNQQKDTF